MRTKFTNAGQLITNKAPQEKNPQWKMKIPQWKLETIQWKLEKRNLILQK